MLSCHKFSKSSPARDIRTCKKENVHQVHISSALKEPSRELPRILSLCSCVFGRVRPTCMRVTAAAALLMGAVASSTSLAGRHMSSTGAAIPSSAERAIVAGGCFWCVESALEIVKGVLRAESGYIGGESGAAGATYARVCDGDTGHAEAVEVFFDPAVLSYTALLRAFFAVHDPTTLNRQGNDVGTQYRSAIFYTSAEQETAAKALIAELAPKYSAPIVTQLAPGPGMPGGWPYFRAEEYHQKCVDGLPYGSIFAETHLVFMLQSSHHFLSPNPLILLRCAGILRRTRLMVTAARQFPRRLRS